ncbi:hypothetical protein, partial [Streptomyces sp. RTd22]|uniref:hypothetical protein n=1 Tax=Streptomyces sp. RTd22 TaxID=1841249 RepID=UPI003B63C448
MADHVVAGSVLVPGTVFVELAVQAGDRGGGVRGGGVALQAAVGLSGGRGWLGAAWHRRRRGRAPGAAGVVRPR